MALAKCRDCGGKVSTKAASCPHCGAPPPQEVAGSRSGCSAFFIAIGCILLFSCLVGVIGTVVDNLNTNKAKAELAAAQEKARSEKLAQDKKELEHFSGNIETHYQELSQLTSQRDPRAIAIAKQFQRFGKTDYKNVSEFVTAAEIIDIEGQLGTIDIDALKRLPLEALEHRKTLLDRLVEIAPNVPSHDVSLAQVTEAIVNAKVSQLESTLEGLDPNDFPHRIATIEKLIDTVPNETSYSYRLQQARTDYQVQRDNEVAERVQKQKEEHDAAERERRALARRAEQEFDSDGLVLLLNTLKGINGEYGGEITGEVVNRRQKKLGYVQISFNLYDGSGAQVGSALANISGLEAGGRWKFKASTFGTEFKTYKVDRLEGF